MVGDLISNATIFHRLRNSERATYDLSYGSSSELTFNPSGPEFDNGELNPFHKPEIREAMNWLINRRYIADELYGGLATPKYLTLGVADPDYARLADVARALELRYRHDPDKAERVITQEMDELGARREAGRWTYEGRPVRLKVLIRSGDERQRVGDYISNLMEDLGFQVERNYRTGEQASRIWMTADPKEGGWHIYTGAWVAPIIFRDRALSFSDFYTPRVRSFPLWQAYTPVPEFDEIADRLQRRDYASLEERDALMARGLDLSMKDSVRVWTVDQISVGPRSRDVEVSSDLAGGFLASLLWPYTVHHRGRIGGEMAISVPSVMTAPWNPVAGSQYTTDTAITEATQDFELLPDPYTGLFWPQRIVSAELTVQGDAPVNRTHDWLTLNRVDTIQVPEDTWIDWSIPERRFITVGEKHPEGLTARTRTRVRYEDGYLERRWHDGSQISLADMVLTWILGFERASEDSRLFDRSAVPDFDVFKQHFRGRRIVSRDPLVIEIYSDQIYLDAEMIVAVRTPSVLPWHTLALGIRAEVAGELAFSSYKADTQDVDWMSLAAGPSLPILDRHLSEAGEEGFVPYAETLGGFLREGEAERRYRALADWRRQRGHFWVGEGPFYIHSIHPVERMVVLRRFADFPDPGDKWLRFTKPEIPELELDGPIMVSTGDGAEFNVRVEFEGAPYPSEAIETLQYLLFDGAGELVLKGEPEPAGDGLWRIRLTTEQLQALNTGAKSLEVIVTSRRVALPAFASHVFVTVPGGGAQLGRQP